MDAIRLLMEEHRLIEEVLDAMERFAAGLSEKERRVAQPSEGRMTEIRRAYSL